MLSGEVILTTGTRAYFTPSATDVMLPARSVAIAVIEFAPRASVTPQPMVPPLNVAGRSLHVTPARPERSSVTVPVADTVTVSSVAPSTGEVKANADAVFPALSVTVPMTVLMPSAVVTWSDGQVSTPDPGSTHVKWAVTGPLYQPFAFGDGVSVTRMTGCA